MATTIWNTYAFEALRKEKRCGVDRFGFYLSNDASPENAAPGVTRLLADNAGSDRTAAVHAALEQCTEPAGVAWWHATATEIVGEYNAAGLGKRSNKATAANSTTPTRQVSSLSGSGAAEASRGGYEAASEWARSATMRARQRVRRAPLLIQERRIAWQLLSGAMFRPVTQAEFDHYLSIPIASEHEEVILRDLGRTLPLHCLFKDESSPGQASLRRLLHAYCSRDPVVGYCQGMGFIAAVLLLHMDETSAFGVLWQMMQGRHYRMCQLFEQGFPLLRKMLSILRFLIGRFLPRLEEHLDALGIDPAFFASHWFMTLFAYQFPVPLVCRIWDLYFSEGWKIVFKVAIALLQWDEELLLSMPMENVLMHVKVIHEGKSPEAIIARAMALPIKERDLRAAPQTEGDMTSYATA